MLWGALWLSGLLGLSEAREKRRLADELAQRASDAALAAAEAAAELAAAEAAAGL